MKKFTMLSVVLLILLAGCKKQDGTIFSLKGKWAVDNSITKYYQNGSVVNTINKNYRGVTWDFNSDGNLIIGGLSSGSKPYTISDSKVNIDGEIYNIRDLGSSSVTLVNKTGNTRGSYTEESFYLKR